MLEKYFIQEYWIEFHYKVVDILSRVANDPWLFCRGDYMSFCISKAWNFLLLVIEELTKVHEHSSDKLFPATLLLFSLIKPWSCTRWSCVKCTLYKLQEPSQLLNTSMHCYLFRHDALHPTPCCTLVPYLHKPQFLIKGRGFEGGCWRNWLIIYPDSKKWTFDFTCCWDTKHSVSITTSSDTLKRNIIKYSLYDSACNRSVVVTKGSLKLKENNLLWVKSSSWQIYIGLHI